MADGVMQVAAWQQYPWLRAGFSTRLGGLSEAYGSRELNLGWTKEDSPDTVAANRKLFVNQVVADGYDAELVTVRQVHGNTVQLARRGQPLATPEGKAVLEGDGLITAEHGLLLGVQTADCTPILIADTRTHAVGAFHAGWRGTVARIVEHGVAAMQQEFGSRPGEMVAAIGPAIRQCCFAVGEDVRQRFAAEFAYAPELFTTVDGQLYADLHAANRRQLLDAGVAPDAITVIAECSACTRTDDGGRKYFSHRAENGVTGRMMSVIGAFSSKEL
jgi:YfiH family protein